MTEREAALVEQNAEKMKEFRVLGPKRYFMEKGRMHQFFEGKKSGHLCCIDEGIAEGMHVAGSGIMMSDEEIDRIIREDGITEIESHEGCGAAALVATDGDPDVFAQNWARRVAERNGIAYTGHRPLKDMLRPAGMHHAELCYYDGTGLFNQNELLPAGFTVTRTLNSSLTSDADLAAKIAFGGHGSNTMTFVILGGPELSYDALRKELEEHLGDNLSRVTITGFDVPEEWLMKARESAAV